MFYKIEIWLKLKISNLKFKFLIDEDLIFKSTLYQFKPNTEILLKRSRVQMASPMRQAHPIKSYKEKSLNSSIHSHTNKDLNPNIVKRANSKSGLLVNGQQKKPTKNDQKKQGLYYLEQNYNQNHKNFELEKKSMFTIENSSNYKGYDDTVAKNDLTQLLKKRDAYSRDLVARNKSRSRSRSSNVVGVDGRTNYQTGVNFETNSVDNCKIAFYNKNLLAAENQKTNKKENSGLYNAPQNRRPQARANNCSRSLSSNSKSSRSFINMTKVIETNNKISQIDHGQNQQIYKINNASKIKDSVENRQRSLSQTSKRLTKKNQPSICDESDLDRERDRQNNLIKSCLKTPDKADPRKNLYYNQYNRGDNHNQEQNRRIRTNCSETRHDHSLSENLTNNSDCLSLFGRLQLNKGNIDGNLDPFLNQFVDDARSVSSAILDQEEIKLQKEIKELKDAKGKLQFKRLKKNSYVEKGFKNLCHLLNQSQRSSLKSAFRLIYNESQKYTVLMNYGEELYKLNAKKKVLDIFQENKQIKNKQKKLYRNFSRLIKPGIDRALQEYYKEFFGNLKEITCIEQSQIKISGDNSTKEGGMFSAGEFEGLKSQISYSILSTRNSMPISTPTVMIGDNCGYEGMILNEFTRNEKHDMFVHKIKNTLNNSQEFPKSMKNPNKDSQFIKVLTKEHSSRVDFGYQKKKNETRSKSISHKENLSKSKSQLRKPAPYNTNVKASKSAIKIGMTSANANTEDDLKKSSSMLKSPNNNNNNSGKKTNKAKVGPPKQNNKNNIILRNKKKISQLSKKPGDLVKKQATNVYGYCSTDSKAGESPAKGDSHFKQPNDNKDKSAHVTPNHNSKSNNANRGSYRNISGLVVNKSSQRTQNKYQNPINQNRTAEKAPAQTNDLIMNNQLNNLNNSTQKNTEQDQQKSYPFSIGNSSKIEYTLLASNTHQTPSNRDCENTGCEKNLEQQFLKSNNIFREVMDIRHPEIEANLFNMETTELSAEKEIIQEPKYNNLHMKRIIDGLNGKPSDEMDIVAKTIRIFFNSYKIQHNQ